MITHSKSQEPTELLADVLASMRCKGVRLWTDKGQLRFKAPQGALTQRELERLRACRTEIFDLLENEGRVGNGMTSLGPLTSAPLTFSQMAHWRLYDLRERPAIRQIASATRLCGQLNTDALKRSLDEMVRRHEALRTRIVIRDGIPVQQISTAGYCQLTLQDLTALPEGIRESEVYQLIEQFILEPIDLAVAPLFGACLLKVRDDEQVLIIAMEHIISDMFSMRVLLRDLYATYTQQVTGHVVALPAISVQPAEFAVRQRVAQEAWLEKNGAYWRKLTSSRRLRFPMDDVSSPSMRLGWDVKYLKIGSELKAELCGWSRQKRTTIVMSCFTAYVGLLLRWCNSLDAVVLFQTDGRVSADIENTIGYFASPLCLRIVVGKDDGFMALSNQVIEKYCEAYERADSFYFAAQESPPEIVRSSCFNWIPPGSGFTISELNGSEYALTCRPVQFKHPLAKHLQIDGDPSILLFEDDDEISGEVWFPLSRFSPTTMDQFGRNFLVCIRALLRQPEEPLSKLRLHG